ncbi:MAG: VOC family protein [Thermomicrobiales bacterium]
MTMELGAFLVSLNVADIAASRAFYEKLGFHVAGGNQDENWLILRSGSTNIGLFQGMFERNMLTFTPGWDDQSQEVDPFTIAGRSSKRLRPKESSSSKRQTIDEGSRLLQARRSGRKPDPVRSVPLGALT